MSGHYKGILERKLLNLQGLYDKLTIPIIHLIKRWKDNTLNNHILKNGSG